MESFIKQLSPVYFWDVDFASLNPLTSQRIIVERVFSLGNLDEIMLVTRYYGKEAVVKTLCGLNYLDPKTLNFCSVMFSVPKKKFKCYTRRQSIAGHWI